MDSHLLVYAPILMVFLLELLAVAVLIAYFSFLKKFQQVEEGYKKLKYQKEKFEATALADAQTKALTIIEDAEKKSQEMIARATRISQSYGEEFGRELQKVSKEQTQLFKQVIDSSREETAASLRKVAEETRELALKEVDELKERLTSQAQQSQNALTAAIADAFAKAEVEIGRYKTERLQYIDAHAAEIVEIVAAQVLPKELSLQQQEDVIMAALEEAKSARVFAIDPGSKR